jgi:ankyrin repeat protein
MANQESLDSNLIRAVKRENINEVRTLLDAGANVNARENELFKNTPLIIATRLCNIDIARVLIKRGADVNLEGSQFIGTPLLEASGTTNSPPCLPMLKLLLDNDADVNKKSGGYDASPLNQAAHSGSLEACEYLIEKGADIHSKSRNGATPLHSACVSGHPNICKLLIELGADIEAEDNKGRTPLFYSITSYHLSRDVIPRLLYDYGANFLHKNNEGQTPLEDVLTNYGSSTNNVYKLFKELEEKYREKIASAKGLAAISAASQFPNYRPGQVPLRPLPNNLISKVGNLLGLKNKTVSLKRNLTENEKANQRLRQNVRNARLFAARQAVAEQHAAKVAEQQSKAAREGWYGWMGGARKQRKTRGKKRKSRTMKKHNKN